MPNSGFENDQTDRLCIINSYFEDTLNQIKGKYFDFIICSGLLHEVQNPKLLLTSIKTICDKNTTVLCNVPNSKSLHLLWAYKAGLIDKVGQLTTTALKLQQNTTFDINSLKLLCNNEGFSIIKDGSYFIKPFNHKKMDLLLKDGYINQNLLDGLYDLTEYFPYNGAEIFVIMKPKISEICSV